MFWLLLMSLVCLFGLDLGVSFEFRCFVVASCLSGLFGISFICI